MKTRLADRLFGEKQMLALSLLSLPGAFFQLVTRVTPSQALVIDLVDWGIIIAFILEYGIRLRLAPSKSRYLTDRWTLLNLFIILVAFGGILVSSPLLFSAPLLRVIRATKFFTESGRSSMELNRRRARILAE